MNNSISIKIFLENNLKLYSERKMLWNKNYEYDPVMPSVHLSRTSENYMLNNVNN